jgi:hypothetical protein
MVFFSFRNIFLDNTRVRIFILFVAIFFPEFNIRLYDKNYESDYFFFPPSKSEYFFSNIGNQNICLENKPYSAFYPESIHFKVFNSLLFLVNPFEDCRKLIILNCLL